MKLALAERRKITRKTSKNRGAVKTETREQKQRKKKRNQVRKLKFMGENRENGTKTKNGARGQHGELQQMLKFL